MVTIPSAQLTGLLPCFLLTLSGFLNAQNEPATDEYRVIPSLPEEAPQVVPEEQINPQQPVRRAIIINPDGSVSREEDPSGTVRPAIPLQPPFQPQPVLSPGQTGTDGLPINPAAPIRMEILSPTPSQVMPERVVDVFFDLSNYKLGDPESGGNRVHVILDNGEPRPIYDAIRPVTFENLAEGGHSIRIFAAKPDGSMFSDPQAFAMVHFYIVRKDFQNYADPNLPFLTVNLPGNNQVTADPQGRMLFDYRIHNFDQFPEHQVRYKIGAYEGFLDRQGPVFWSNLAVGKHRLEVELLKENGQPEIGPFNQVTREFSLNRIRRAEPVDPANPENEFLAP